MYLRPRIVLSTPHRTRPPLPLLRAPRFSSLVRLVLTCVFIRLLALFDFFIHAPSPVSTAPHKVRTSPFPSPRRARTAALHIRLHRRAQRSCALCDHLLRLHHPPLRPSAPTTPRGCPLRARNVGCWRRARTPLHVSAPQAELTRSSSRGASKGTGPSAGACLPVVAAPLERGYRAARGQEGWWPEGGGAPHD